MKLTLRQITNLAKINSSFWYRVLFQVMTPEEFDSQDYQITQELINNIGLILDKEYSNIPKVGSKTIFGEMTLEEHLRSRAEVSQTEENLVFLAKLLGLERPASFPSGLEVC